MSGENKGKKRSKAFYRKSAHGTKQQKTDDNRLRPGIKGFLITCNHDENGAVREGYNILNDYADRIYGQGKSKLMDEARHDCSVDRKSEDGSDDDDDDVEKSMRKELDEMKTVSSQERRFQKCNTKAKNLLFIRSTVEEPVKVSQLIMEDIAKNRLQRARYAARILPVVGTCKAHTPDIEKLAQTCLPPFFDAGNKEQPSSYTVMFRARCNNTTTCGKTSVIPAITNVIKEINPNMKFSWSDFEVAVIIEIVCTVCCLVIAPGFNRLRKYNLQELQQGPRCDQAETSNLLGSVALQNDKDSLEIKQSDCVVGLERKQIVAIPDKVASEIDEAIDSKIEKDIETTTESTDHQNLITHEFDDMEMKQISTPSQTEHSEAKSNYLEGNESKNEQSQLKKSNEDSLETIDLVKQADSAVIVENRMANQDDNEGSCEILK